MPEGSAEILREAATPRPGEEFLPDCPQSGQAAIAK